MTLCSTQNRSLEEIKCSLLFGLIFPIHLIHSYIHSGDSSQQLRKGLSWHWQQLKQRHFLRLRPLGPLLLLQRKNLKELFQSRKEAKDPSPVNELRTFLQKNQ
jgi:hypothetical protein